MAYRNDVAYLEQMQPHRVAVASMEFARMVRVIRSVLPDLERRRGHVRWVGDVKDLYDRRLNQACEIVGAFKPAFTDASQALEHYAKALREALGHIHDGKTAEQSLGQLIAPILRIKSGSVLQAEPMRQWDDLRSVNGIWDWLEEHFHQDEINRVRADADAAWNKAAKAYDEAIKVEREARKVCVETLAQARRGLPDFLASSADAKRIIDRTPGLKEMIYAAADDPEARDASLNLSLYSQPDDSAPMRRYFPEVWPFKQDDWLGDYNPTMSDSEIKVVEGMDTLDKRKLWALRAEAYAAAAREFPGEFMEDGHRDAFTHAYLHARMVQEFGSDFSNRLGNAHEAQPDNPAVRESMDLHNNDVGRSIVATNPNASPEEIARLARQAVQDGRTVVIDKHGQLKYSDTVEVGKTGKPL